MNKIIITLCLSLVSIICFSQKGQIDSIQEAYMKNNKKMIDEASPMIEYFLKYQDTSKKVTQSDFNELMSIYGGSAKESNSGGLTKEQAFSFLDWYTKASMGKKEKQEKETIDETEGEEFPKQTEQEKLIEKAESELPDQIKSYLTTMSYEDFKELMKIAKPEATESEIRNEYLKMQNSAKKL